MMAIPRRRVVLHQPVHDLLAEEELKELGFGDVRGQFDVIEVTLVQSRFILRLVLTGFPVSRRGGRRSDAWRPRRSWSPAG